MDGPAANVPAQISRIEKKPEPVIELRLALEKKANMAWKRDEVSCANRRHDEGLEERPLDLETLCCIGGPTTNCRNGLTATIANGADLETTN